MRRIYESDALSRDEEGAFTPHEGEEHEPQSFRSVNATAWSDRLLPHALRRRAVGLRVEVPRTEFDHGEPVPFRVTMSNALPVPVSIRTRSPVLWQWKVDGHAEASHVSLRSPPDETATFRFDRGERKQFHKRWSGLFRVSDREWVRADAGEHAIRAEVNVDDPAATGLVDEATVRVR